MQAVVTIFKKELENQNFKVTVTCEHRKANILKMNLMAVLRTYSIQILINVTVI